MFNSTNTKKICFVTTTSTTLKSFLTEQSELLISKGWNVTWICSEDNKLKNDIPDCVHYISIKLKRGIDLFGTIQLIYVLCKIFKREKFHIIQYSTPNATFCCSISAWIENVPVRLYAQWGIRYVGFSGLLRKTYKLFEKISCNLSTVIQPDSTSNLEFAISEGLYSRSKGIVIWNGSACGVNINKFDIENKKRWRDVYRRANRINDDQFVIGFVGSIRKDKGCNELIGACKSLFKYMPNIWLMLIGDKGFYNTIENDLREWLESSNRVICIPPNDHIPQYMACFDIFAFPSYREGFGTVVIEAEAMGVPVVVSDIPGPIDAMQPNKTGLVVPVKNQIALEKALNKLILDEDLLKSFSESAVGFAKANFEQTVFLDKILEDKDQLFMKSSK